MWTTRASATCSASPETVWKLWDTANWTQWDHELEWVRIDGPFQLGTSGELKPVDGPRIRFTITSCELNRSFGDRSQLPLTRLDFHHNIEPSAEGGVTITHTATFSGPLSFLFSRIIGKKLKVGLPIAVQKLAQLAEKQERRE